MGNVDGSQQLREKTLANEGKGVTKYVYEKKRLPEVFVMCKASTLNRAAVDGDRSWLWFAISWFWYRLRRL